MLATVVIAFKLTDSPRVGARAAAPLSSQFVRRSGPGVDFGSMISLSMVSLPGTAGGVGQLKIR